jgi:molybdopterin-binding protein
MNIVNGVITSIDKCDCFNRTVIKVRGEADFVVLTLGLKDAFRENAKVSLMFKESNVMVAKGRRWLFSVENSFPCSVTKITKGEIFAELELKTSFGVVRALVDAKSYGRLNIVLSDELNLFVKANEISLMIE